MKKKITWILEGIGGWTIAIFGALVLLPIRFISIGIVKIGEFTNINAIRKFGCIIGIGIAYIFIDMIDIVLEVMENSKDIEKGQDAKRINEELIEYLKSQL